MKLRLFLVATASIVRLVATGKRTQETTSSRDISASSFVEKRFAMGYVVRCGTCDTGALEAQRRSIQQGKGPITNSGIPAMVTNQQMADTVKKYILDNPAERHYGAGVVVWAALTDAFPALLTPK